MYQAWTSRRPHFLHGLVAGRCPSRPSGTQVGLVLDSHGCWRRWIIAARGRPVENVLGFATSAGGRDLAIAVEELNRLGYSCDVFVGDAKWFVPQSRPRLFIVGLLDPPEASRCLEYFYISTLMGLEVQTKQPESPATLPSPELTSYRSTEVREFIERIAPDDNRWWDAGRIKGFVDSLSSIQAARVNNIIQSGD